MTDEEMKRLFDISEKCSVATVNRDELKLIRKAFWELKKIKQVCEVWHKQDGVSAVQAMMKVEEIIDEL